MRKINGDLSLFDVEEKLRSQIELIPKFPLYQAGGLAHIYKAVFLFQVE